MTTIPSLLASLKPKTAIPNIFASAQSKTASTLNALKPANPASPKPAAPIPNVASLPGYVPPASVSSKAPVSSPVPKAFAAPVKPQMTATAPTYSSTPTPSPTPPAPTKQAVPTYGSDVKDATGKVIGQAKFDPNTGAPLANSNAAPTPTTPQPTVPSAAASAVTSAEDTYRKLMSPSKDEITTQEDLDKLIDSTKQGYLGTEGQTIPMQFITGQLAAIEKRAEGLAEPLQTKLARLQAARTSSLDASKFALDRADTALKAETDKSKTQTVGNNIVKLNPETGQYESVYSAPVEDKHSPAYIEYQDAVGTGYKGSFTDYQNADANRKAKATGAGGGTGNGGASTDPTVLSWTNLIKGGKATLSNVPAAYKNSVANNLNATASTEVASETKNNALTAAQDLLSKFDSGNKWAVGGTSIFGTLPGTGARDFVNTYDQVKSLLSLDNVKLLKGQGAVSDAERDLLAKASTKLSRDQSEAEFRTTLQDIITALSGKGAVGSSQPEAMELNGQVLHLQADGTYQ